MHKNIPQLFIRDLTANAPLLNAAKAATLSAIALHRLNSDRPTKEEILPMLKKHQIDEERLDAILFDLVRHGYVLIVDNPDEPVDRFNIPSSIYAYFRTGLRGFLREFETVRLQTSIELVAEFVHRMNEEMSGFLFEADAAHEKTIDFFERLQSMPELMEVIQALRPGTEGKNYFVLACFTFLAAGQFTLNRQPLDLDKWAKILRPNLAERRSFYVQVLDPKAPVYLSGYLTPAEMSPKGLVKQVIPPAELIERWSLKRDYLPFDESESSDAFQVTAADEIRPRTLFFPAPIRQQFDAIEAQLVGDHFEQSSEELRLAGVPPGLSVLLAGASGVGKTACAEVWSKASGRSLVRVNLASLRGKYMGESEAQTRALFRALRSLRARMEREPIVLLDEADGFMHRRQGDGQSDHPTETNIIAILLQEIEAFDGILVATTNHARNIDPAFYRRFLFTLNVPMPDSTLRVELLQRAFPSLTAAESQALAQEVRFAPAHLERVMRQMQLLGENKRPPKQQLDTLRQRLVLAARGWDGIDGPGRNEQTIGFIQ